MTCLSPPRKRLNSFLLRDSDVGLDTDLLLRRSEGDDLSRHEARRRGLVTSPIHDQVYGLERIGYRNLWIGLATTSDVSQSLIHQNYGRPGS